MKKVLCILISLMLIFGTVTMYSSAVSYSPEKAAASNEVVAMMYHCVVGVSWPYLFGHSWICIQNISDEPLTVGPETIQPGQMISAGLHSARGMLFNKEMKQMRGKTVDAIETALTREGLKKAENEIISSRWNYYELFGHNCTNFSAAVWKAVTGRQLRTFIFPAVIKNQFSSSEKIRLYIG